MPDWIRYAAGCVLLTAVLGSPHAAGTPSPDAQHRAAVADARAGRFAQAESVLRGLLARYPDRAEYWYDLAVVLTWADRGVQALELLAGMDIERTPRYVLEPLAKAARNAKQFPTAVKLYGELVRRFPDVRAGHVGLALASADAGDTEAALRQLEPWRRNVDAEIAGAFAYVYEARRDYVSAIYWYQRGLEFDSASSALRKAYLLAASRLGAAHLAADLARQLPEPLDAATQAGIQGDVAATTVRWGDLPVADESRRFEETDKAIALLTRQIDDPSTPSGAVRRARLDRLLAWRDRKMMAKIPPEYTALIGAGVALPDYALNAVADAYLYLRQPERARVMYADLLTRRPDAFNLRMAMFFTLVELEDYAAATELIDRLAAEQPALRRRKGLRRIKENPRKLTAETAAALARAFADRLAEAQARYTAMIANAPYNSDLRAELGTVYLWRGWPRRALAEFDLASRIEPEHLGARIGRARLWVETGDWRNARPAVAELERLYARDTGVRAIAKLAARNRAPRLKLDYELGKSSGSTFGSRDHRTAARLESALFADHWRGYAAAHRATALLQEGLGNYRRAAAGFIYTTPGLRLDVALSANMEHVSRVGVSVTGRYEIDDFWSVDGSVETFSQDTPSRALINGIRAYGAGLGVTWRGNEGRAWSVNANARNFTDGNRRRSVSVSGFERFVNQPRYKLDTRFDLFASRNTLANAAYFNPRRDYAASFTLDNALVVYRHYETSLTQRVAASYGRYWQKGFDPGETWALDLQHRWSLDTGRDLIYGVKRSRNVYDGAPELGWRAYATLDWRF